MVCATPQKLNEMKLPLLRTPKFFHSDDKAFVPGHCYCGGGRRCICPSGWRRCNLGHDYQKLKGWKRVYQGVNFEYGLTMVLSGMMECYDDSRNDIGVITPSIIYAAHPKFSEVKKISSKDTIYFNSSNNPTFVQMVLELRVDPEYKFDMTPQTLGYKGFNRIDNNFENDILELIFDHADKNYTDSKIVCIAVMVRQINNNPALLKESRWWWNADYCDCWCDDLQAKCIF